MPKLDEVVKTFEAVGDKCVHQNKLIEDLKRKGYDEIGIVAAINNAIESDIFQINTSGGISKKTLSS